MPDSASGVKIGQETAHCQSSRIRGKAALVRGGGGDRAIVHCFNLQMTETQRPSTILRSELGEGTIVIWQRTSRSLSRAYWRSWSRMLCPCCASTPPETSCSSKTKTAVSGTHVQSMRASECSPQPSTPSSPSAHPQAPTSCSPRSPTSTQPPDGRGDELHAHRRPLRPPQRGGAVAHRRPQPSDRPWRSHWARMLASPCSTPSTSTPA